MRFPLSSIDPQAYSSSIAELLDQDDCHIFFDTNLFSQLFKINITARSEFYTWMEAQKAKNKAHITSWSVHEYADRYINRKIGDYVADIKKVKTLHKEMENVRKFLKMYVDDSTIKGSHYADKDAYFTELDAVADGLRRIANATKEANEYHSELNSELSRQFESIILKSDMQAILSDLSGKATERYLNRIPPGYMDDTKELNKYGDLIVWMELLEFCRVAEVKKSIFITNDGKKDFVYMPLMQESSGKKMANNSLSIADPRLVAEFHAITDSDDLYIINFNDLIQMLYKKDSTAFQHLSKAIQLEQIKEKKEGETEAEIVEEIPSAEEDITDEPVAVEAETDGYSADALADKDFDTTGAGFVNRYIEKLKSYTWSTQNEAIAKINAKDRHEYTITERAKNVLFVLGRNIYQAACGGAFSARNYIKDLTATATFIEPFWREHMVNGMFYEVYFDGSNAFRYDKIKWGYADALFALQTQELFARNIEFIRGALEPFRDYLLVRPNTHPELVTATITIEADVNPTNPEIRLLNIASIQANGREVLINEPEEFLALLGDEIIVKSKLEKRIGKDISIPLAQTTFIFYSPEPLHEEDQLRLMGHKKIGLGSVPEVH